METTSNPPPNAVGGRATPGRLRPAVDSLICVALAVILFRTFEVEGYMISTGSMAPFLLGYHKRVECPSCGYRFALGISEEEAQKSVPAERASTDWSPQVECPNCGQTRLDVSRIPPNQGDQLLVHKHAYSFQPPRRWEVVVFRNPNKPSQAYVKRVVGLSGERLQILGGDLFINGRIERKDYAAQQSLRIPVFVDAVRPRKDAGWQERWRVDDAKSLWVRRSDGFVWDGAPHAAAAQVEDRSGELEWVSYRHWLRAGGRHVTAVAAPPGAAALVEALSEGSDDGAASQPVVGAALPVRYDGAAHELVCTGVMSDAVRDRLASRAGDAELRAAVERLAAESHLAPIADDYGYNRSAGETSHAVRDIMLSAEVSIGRGRGEFVLQMTDGVDVFSCVLDAGRRTLELRAQGQAEPLRTAPFSPTEVRQPMLLEMSLIDRQVLIALNGKVLFAPWTFERSASQFGEPPRFPVRFGVRGLQVRVSGLKLFRDVYYTGGENKHGVDEPQQLAPDEYFVLGDNSPVSLDSRSWPSAGVSAHLLMGKPFLVHLPSRPGKVKIGRWMAYIRIPDVERMRYIR